MYVDYIKKGLHMNLRDEQNIQRNMIFNTVGTLVYSVCQWLMSVIIVRLSGYEDAGIWAIAASVTASPAIVGLFNIRSFQVSDLEGQFSDHVYIRSRTVTNLVSFLVCAVMVFAGGYNLEKAAVIFVYMLFKIIEAYADVYYGIEQRWNRMDYVGISLAVRGIGTVLLFIVVFLTCGSMLLGIVAMSLLSLAVVLVYDRTIVNKRKQKESTGREHIANEVRQLLVTCFPLAVVAFLNNLSINMPKIFLERFYGSEIMGFYSSVSSPTVIIQLAATTIFAPLIPVLTLAYNEREKSRFLGVIKKYLLLVLGFSIICMAGSAVLGEWGLVLLYGEGIRPYAGLLVPIVVVSIFIAVNANLFSICTLLREIKIQYLIGFLGIAASLLLSVWLVRAAASYGVICATLGTLGVQILIQAAIIIKKVKEM